MKNLGGRRKTKWAVIALILTLGVSIGLAQDQGGRRFGPPGGPPPFGPAGGPPPFLRELNLTDEQKTKIQQINESFRQNTKTYMEQLRALRPEPFDFGTDAAFDETAVRTAAEKRAAVQVELEVARARQMSQIYATLTAEQKAKLAELRQQFEQKRQEWEANRPSPSAEGNSSARP